MEACRATIRVVGETPVEKSVAQRYDRGFAVYRSLYPALRESFTAIDGLS
jgi:xylulokinase